MAPRYRERAAHSLHPTGIRLCSGFSVFCRASGACMWRSVRAHSVLGGIHTGHGQQARDLVFVEVAPCPAL
jgi:hypothetical protein